MFGALRKVVGSLTDVVGTVTDAVGGIRDGRHGFAERFERTVEILAQLFELFRKFFVEAISQVARGQSFQAFAEIGYDTLAVLAIFAHLFGIATKYRHRPGHTTDAIAILGVRDRTVQITLGHGFHAFDRFDIRIADQFLEPQSEDQDQSDLAEMNREVCGRETAIEKLGDDGNRRRCDEDADHYIELAPYRGLAAEPVKHSGISFAIATEWGLFVVSNAPSIV